VTALRLDGISKQSQRDQRLVDVLVDVSLSIELGEVVNVSGARGAGRSTLVRIAGGALAPDAGDVLVEGVDLFGRRRADVARRVVVCGTQFLPAHGRVVYQQVMLPLIALRISRIDASLRAHRALERVGAERLATKATAELVPDEIIRIALARAIVRNPAVLLMDEPTAALGILEREPLLRLVSEIAKESRTAVLVTGDETASIAGADRCLRLSAGRLLGDATPSPAEVISLRRSSSGTSA